MPVDASLLIPGADDHADPIHHDNECGQKQQGYRKNGAGCRHSIFSPNDKDHPSAGVDEPLPETELLPLGCIGLFADSGDQTGRPDSD